MCFSATASFIAGTGLVIAGTYAFTQVRQKNQYMLSSIPFLFGMQQLCEGVVWVVGRSTDPAIFFYTPYAAYAFLFFALVVWPTWIPLTAYQLEFHAERKRVLGWFVFAGALVSFYLLMGMLMQQPVVSAQGCHVLYEIRPLQIVPTMVSVLVYCAVVILPFFIVSLPYAALFGVALAASCLLAYLFFAVYFTSVWCFFAALLSIFVLFLLKRWK